MSERKPRYGARIITKQTNMKKTRKELKAKVKQLIQLYMDVIELRIIDGETITELKGDIKNLNNQHRGYKVSREKEIFKLKEESKNILSEHKKSLDIISNLREQDKVVNDNYDDYCDQIDIREKEITKLKRRLNVVSDNYDGLDNQITELKEALKKESKLKEEAVKALAEIGVISEESDIDNFHVSHHMSMSPDMASVTQYTKEEKESINEINSTKAYYQNTTGVK